jgi:hypothetical protein
MSLAGTSANSASGRPSACSCLSLAISSSTVSTLTALREPPAKLESFEQDGEAEPGRACLVAEQCTHLVGKRPVLGEFVRVPILFHGPAPRTPMVRRGSIPRSCWASAGSWLRWNGVPGRATFAVRSRKRTPCGILPGKPRGCGASTTSRATKPNASSSKATAHRARKRRRTDNPRYFAEISAFATLRPDNALPRLEAKRVRYPPGLEGTSGRLPQAVSPDMKNHKEQRFKVVRQPARPAPSGPRRRPEKSR